MAVDDARLLVRLEANTSKLIKEFQKAEAETKRRMKAIEDSVSGANRKVDDKLTRAGKAYSETGKGLDSYRFAAQNAAYQIGDFAVQVASGTSATRALAQQLPQLVGGFGLIGAVAGAAIPIGIMLASSLLDLGEDAETVADQLKTLESAMSALRSANGAAAMSSADLMEKFGSQADAARQVLDIQRQLAEINAQRAFMGASGAAATEIFSAEAKDLTLANLADAEAAFNRAMDYVLNKGLSVSDGLKEAWIETYDLTGKEVDQVWAYNDALSTVIRNYDVGLDAAKQMLQAYVEMQAADTSEARADAARRLAQLIWDSTDGLKNASDESIALYKNLLDVVSTGIELAGIDMASGINAAVSSAAALAQQLGVSVALASKLMAGGYSGKGAVVYDPRDPRYDKGAAERAKNFGFDHGSVSPFDPSRAPKIKSGGGRGGGGRGGGGKTADPTSFIEQRLATAQAAAEAAKIEAQASLMGAEAATREKVKIELLNEAKRQKLDLDQKSAKTGRTLREEIDLQAQAIADLTTETDRYRERAQFMDQQNQALKDGFLDAIVEGKNFGEVLQGVARQLAKAALEAALFNSGPFARAGGSVGGGLFSGIVKAIFGGARANGGPVSPGKAYLVGERGPELFTPSRAGAIVPNGAGAARMAPAKVVVQAVPNPYFDLRVTQISASGDVRSAAASRRALPSVMRDMQNRGTR